MRFDHHCGVLLDIDARGFSVRLSVVHPGVGSRHDCYSLTALRHCQRAVGSTDVVVRGSRALVQGVGKGIVAGTDLSLAAGHVVGRTLALNEAVAGHSNSVVRQRRAVVLLAVRRARQGDAARRDCQGAIGRGNRLVLACVLQHIGERVVVRRRVRYMDHIGGVGNCQLVAGRQRERAVLVGFNRCVAVLDRISRSRQRTAVVHLGVGCGLDGECLGGLAHRQRAVGSGDAVVRRGCTDIQRVGEGVLTGANDQPVTGGLDTHTLALCKAVASDGHVAVVERCAVVDAGGVHGLDLYAAGMDGQLAVDGSDGELIGHVVALGILHDRRTGNVVGVGRRKNMLKVSGSDIQLTRGDSAYFNVEILREDGTMYYREDGDSLIFTVKRSYNSDYEYIQKEIEGLVLQLSGEDTGELDYGNYWYDIQLTTTDGGVYTVVGPARFIMREEVTF